MGAYYSAQERWYCSGKGPPLVDRGFCREFLSDQDLTYHLRDHDHAHIAPQAFMTTETEMKIIIPVALGINSSGESNARSSKVADMVTGKT